MRWLAVIAALALAAPAAAAPKGAQAKAAFDRGVAAYQKGSFAAASEALGASFKLEPDVETLFAWAQSERQQEHCDKAIELYQKLLGFDLPAENKKVVVAKMDECKALLPAKPPVEPVKPVDKPVDKPIDKPIDKPADKPADGSAQRPPPADKPADPGPPLTVEKGAQGPARSPWWKDPAGDAMVGGGVAAGVAGALLLASSKHASDDLKSRGKLMMDKDFVATQDRAKLNGTLGVAATAVGGALIIGGIVRYATRGGGKERTAVTGWLSPGGGGLAAVGRF